MAKQVFRLVNDAVRRNARQAILNAPDSFQCEIRPRTRSLDQNNLMWSILTDLSKQVDWHVNGVLTKITPEDWKDVLSASLDQETRMSQGLQGGLVLLGKRTSRMTVKDMTDLIDLAYAFGAEKKVRWSPTSLGGGL